MLPNFIGIGVPKSGTTWIFNCLKEHPEICITELKETSFFTFRYNPERISWYESLFDQCNELKAFGELSVDYWNSQQAAERIRYHLPNVRLFVSLRDPVDQIYSFYWHQLRQNFNSKKNNNHISFEAALEKYEEILINPALYAHNLKMWLKLFDRSQIHVIIYNDICCQPSKVIEDLYNFLGVNKHYTPRCLTTKGSSARRGVSPKNALAYRIYTSLYGLTNRHFYIPLKKLAGVRVATRVKDNLRLRQISETIFYQKGYPKMNSETRLWLQNKLIRQIEELEVMIDRSLEDWK